jgi:hypothetical protein
VIFVTSSDGRTAAGTGIVVRLLSASEELTAKLGTLRADCTARQADLTAKAAGLKERAGKAMRSIENTSRAFEEADRARAERRRTLQERTEAARACRAREDELLEAHAKYRALTSAEGRYLFGEVAAGSYTVQATMEAGGQIHQWMVPLSVETGRPRTLDLTPGNRLSVEDLPQDS